MQHYKSNHSLKKKNCLEKTNDGSDCIEKDFGLIISIFFIDQQCLEIFDMNYETTCM